MKKKLPIIIGLLVLLVVGYMMWKKRNPKPDTPEEKAGAFGHACYCQGRYNGTCFLPGCCERKCRRKIISQMDH